MRLFLGIPLPANVIEELSAVTTRLRSPHDGLRWSAPESWHITLQFLGDTSQEQSSCIVRRLRELRRQPFSLRIESLSCFDRAAVLFADVQLTPELIALQRVIATATAHCGFVAEARAYHPHITLARGEGKDGSHVLRRLKSTLHEEPKFSSFTAVVFLLYESVVSSAGSRYEVREHFQLG
jgi:2'-5' RNA ligase